MSIPNLSLTDDQQQRLANLREAIAKLDRIAGTQEGTCMVMLQGNSWAQNSLSYGEASGQVPEPITLDDLRSIAVIGLEASSA